MVLADAVAASAVIQGARDKNIHVATFSFTPVPVLSELLSQISVADADIQAASWCKLNHTLDCYKIGYRGTTLVTAQNLIITEGRRRAFAKTIKNDSATLKNWIGFDVIEGREPDWGVRDALAIRFHRPVDAPGVNRYVYLIWEVPRHAGDGLSSFDLANLRAAILADIETIAEVISKTIPRLR